MRSLIAVGAIALGVVAAVRVGQRREATEAERLNTALQGDAGLPGRADLDIIAELPAPVVRYLRHVLTDGQEPIRTATLEQAGVLRTDMGSEYWTTFTAHHRVAPPLRGFLWDAKARMPLRTHVRVLDSYQRGVGSGRVSLMSMLVLASESGGPELNSGALHRFLAEAVWYPTALLPGSGIRWSALDEYRALATLTDHGTTVALEFRFNQQGEVTGIYSEGRYGRFGEEYRPMPWEGRFRDYQVRDGVRIPLYGEVGWYDEAGELQLVWRGNVTGVRYEFGG